jgi:hypothetical protein
LELVELVAVVAVIPPDILVAPEEPEEVQQESPEQPQAVQVQPTTVVVPVRQLPLVQPELAEPTLAVTEHR